MKVWLMTLLVTISVTAKADKVGQGAGTSENNIRFSYRYLDQYIQICLAMSDCVENESQAEILRKILLSSVEERLNGEQIFFKSHQEDGIFLIDGKVRIAKTWDYVGAPIYFNIDQLYWTNDVGIVEGVSMPMAVTLLIHELGHHHGIVDHDWLDALGRRVSKVLIGRVSSHIVNPNNNRLNIEAISIYLDFDPILAPFTQVLFSDGDNYFDLGQTIFSKFSCPALDGKGTPKLLGLGLWNFSWRNVYSDAPVLTAYARPYCLLFEIDSPTGKMPIFWMPRGFGVQIQTKLRQDPVDFLAKFDPNGFDVRKVTCADEPKICDWETANLIGGVKLK